MAARIPQEISSANRDLVTTGKFNPKDLEWLANWKVCALRLAMCFGFTLMLWLENSP